MACASMEKLSLLRELVQVSLISQRGLRKIQSYIIIIIIIIRIIIINDHGVGTVTERSCMLLLPFFGVWKRPRSDCIYWTLICLLLDLNLSFTEGLLWQQLITDDLAFVFCNIWRLSYFSLTAKKLLAFSNNP
jgi:hypothetical protein